MAVKTFTNGEVLTSSDTNTYLANSGLVYIKSQTIGSAVASVAVSDAFSSTYDSYFVSITDVTVSANQPALRVTLGATATGYLYAGFYIALTSGTLSSVSSGATTFWIFADAGNATAGSYAFTLHSPNLAKRTFMTSQNCSTAWSTVYNGTLNNNDQYTAFTLAPSAGTLTGGTIRVYGYRKA